MAKAEVVRSALRRAPVVEEPENGATVRTLLRYEDPHASFSVTWVRLIGRHRRLRTQRAARCYYVLQGTVTCEIAGYPPERLVSDEVIVVPPGLPYALYGNVTYLVWNVPAFEPGDDEYLE